MIIKVKADLSGAVVASKGQEVSVSRAQGDALIARNLAVEIKAVSKALSKKVDAEASQDVEA